MNCICETYYHLQIVFKTKTKPILRVGWISCCLFATLITTVWQFSNYCNIKDQTIVEYRRFNEIEADLYPSVTLCWAMRINEEKLRRNGKLFNSTTYAKFLAGVVWDNDMQTVDYDNVMPVLGDYILLYGYRTSYWGNEILYHKKYLKKSWV